MLISLYLLRNGATVNCSQADLEYTLKLSKYELIPFFILGLGF